jgi:hypothetical protein
MEGWLVGSKVKYWVEWKVGLKAVERVAKKVEKLASLKAALKVGK